jgi:methionyl-tRNA formyltransferase
LEAFAQPIMVVCIAGKNRIAVEAAEFIRQSFPKLALRVAVNQTDNGIDTWQPSLKKWATDNAVEISPLEDLYPIENLLFISLEYDRLLQTAAFKSSRLFNLHFSYLPEYKGMYTSIWPLLDGKNYSGVTLHKIDAGIDTGDIIVRKRIPLLQDTTSRQLYELYFRRGLRLFQDWFPRLLQGDYTTTPQPAKRSSYRSRRSIDFANLKINLQQTAQSIHDQIRAFAFPEYQLAKVCSHPVTSSDILSRRSTLSPGEVVNESHATIEIATVDYDLVCHKDPLQSFISACSRGDTTEARLHLTRIAWLEGRNASGWTPLMVAAFYNLPVLVELLIESGANVDAANFKGTTVLMYAKTGAVCTGDYKSLALLLSRGADPRLRDCTGRTVLDHAREEGATEAGVMIERHLI